MHRDLIRVTFGVTPTVFRNTELIYSNDLARKLNHLVMMQFYLKGQIISSDGEVLDIFTIHRNQRLKFC